MLRLCEEHMNKTWSELNKKMQNEFKRKETFFDGINSLLLLRNELFKIVESFFSQLNTEDFSVLPFPKSKGNDNATIAWSIYHLFRIEDVVCNSLIKNVPQIFFTGGFEKRMNSSIITTGNELSNQQMIDFSKALNIQELFSYAKEVKLVSDKMILELTSESLKTKISSEKKSALEKLNVVSTDESSIWLIDYWCGKDIRGLLQMPFSRHWIMHIEACKRISNVIEKISLCGDNCTECPRYNARTTEEQKTVAELWYKVGFRDKIVSPDEIVCNGCSSHKKCTYGLVECTKNHGVKKCNQCDNFPCEKINAMLIRSKEHRVKCKEVCTIEKYEKLRKAFFEKEENLKK